MTPSLRRGDRRATDWSHKRLRWTFVTPALGFLTLMVAFPVLFTIMMSFTNARGAVNKAFDFIGPGNYAALLSDFQRFWPAVFRTLLFTFSAVSIQLVLGLGIALLLMRPFRGQRWIRTSILLPVVATPVAVGMMWMMIFQPTIGVANEIMRILGLPEQAWVSDASLAMPLIIVVDTWQWTPMMTLILLAGLVSLPEEPFEAARIDGANAVQILIHVILPLLRPAIVAAVLLRSIDALKTFDIIYTIKGPGGGSMNEAETLNIYGYTLSFQYADYGLASALLVIFFIVTLGFCAGMLALGRKPS